MEYFLYYKILLFNANLPYTNWKMEWEQGHIFSEEAFECVCLFLPAPHI